MTDRQARDRADALLQRLRDSAAALNPTAPAIARERDLDADALAVLLRMQDGAEPGTCTACGV